MQIIIRPYEQSDKADVCKLLNQTSNVPLGEDMFEMQEARIRTYPFYKRIVFTVNNEVVGMAQLLHATGMTPQGFLSQTIIVDAAHRGRGSRTLDAGRTAHRLADCRSGQQSRTAGLGRSAVALR
ncbi:hypothetical protein GC102_07110 [Paenibacillus sp. LMG 31460]|uniref:N-acetyltransferase domain-containing protein n=1 Tax=Paenibacillus germinis TaxID=2654979 RepID=A0ABX1YWP9_9BACL|nr:hypothetical protein [Paenibacillus germinis]NOU85547.1 hypothetical protein [Paenibacillus germinis]